MKKIMKIVMVVPEIGKSTANHGFKPTVHEIIEPQMMLTASLIVNETVGETQEFEIISLNCDQSMMENQIRQYQCIKEC